MSYVRMETTGQDGLISHVSSGPQYYNSVIDSNPEENILLDFISKGFTFLIKYAAILTIPMFIIFLPLGIFKFFKNRDEKKWTIIIFSLILLIPAFYAYSRGFQEMRYLFILYPIFCICIGFTFTEIEKKINRKNLFFVIFLIGIISSSLLFTNLMILDFNHEKEIFDISKDLAKEMSFVNRDYEGLSYFAWVKKDLENNFPILSTELAKTSEIKIVMIGKNTSHDFDNLDEYLKYGKKQGMNHLVLDGSNLDNEMLVHIFENEEQYPFLEKIYDSSEKNYSYHVKAYKINYSEFDSTNKNE